MWVSPEVEDSPRSFQTEHLALRNLAVLAVLVVGEEERVEPAVRVKALARVGYVVGRIRRKDPAHELVGQSLALRREIGHRNSRESTVPALEFDLRLDRSVFQKRFLFSSGIEAAKQALSEQELVAIEVARQSGALIPALVAVDLWAAKGRSLAALATQSQVQVRTRKDHLIRGCRGIAADQHAHQVHSGPAREILLGHALAALL